MDESEVSYDVHAVNYPALTLVWHHDWGCTPSSLGLWGTRMSGESPPGILQLLICINNSCHPGMKRGWFYLLYCLGGVKCSFRVLHLFFCSEISDSTYQCHRVEVSPVSFSTHRSWIQTMGQVCKLHKETPTVSFHILHASCLLARRAVEPCLYWLLSTLSQGVFCTSSS
jgi:hypothetical protein